jgi:hypothetical protein
VYALLPGSAFRGKKMQEFQKVVTHGSTGPKLNEAARLLVVTAIVEGLSNEEVRARLQAAGHERISPQAMQRYRRSAEVREAVNTVVCEASDAARISLYGRLVLLNAEVEALVLLMAEYGKHEEVIGEREDGTVITRLVDSRKTRDYTDKHIVLLGYLKEISRLVDRPRRQERPAEPHVPTFDEQVATAMQALLNRNIHRDAD